MITATIIAVALGLAPVDSSNPSQVINGDYESKVGRFSQSVDRGGTVHVRGFNPTNGAPYELTISRHGDVEAAFADQVVTFRVQPVQ